MPHPLHSHLSPWFVRLVRTLAWVVLSCGALTVLGTPGLALDAQKTGESLAQRAAKAFESGNMAEASALYREAYKIDANQSAYLYGAGRAAHTARDLRQAELDYVAFIDLPNADPARVQKAKGFLENVREGLSVEKMAEAKQAESAGDALLAATFYLEAWRMAPDQAEPLLKAAILERQLGDKKAAIGHLQRYLQLAPQDASGRGTAEALLKQLGGTVLGPAPLTTPVPAVATTTKPATQPTEIRPPPQAIAVSPPGAQAHSSRPVLGWTAIGVGGAAAIGATVLAILASGQQATLDGNKLPTGQFDGGRITVDQAASEQTSVNGKWTGMGVAAGVSVAAIGVGVWLVAGASPEVAVMPTWDGLSVAGRF